MPSTFSNPREYSARPSPLRVGYLRDGHSELRSIVGAVDRESVEYRLVPRGPIRLSWSSTAARIAKRFSPTLADRLRDKAVVFRSRGDVDLIHGFNDVGFGDLPWISTFESVIPRYHHTRSLHHGHSPGFEKLANDTYVRRGMEALAADSCRALIAMSECNLAMQRALLQHFPDVASRIERKLLHIHPPQRVHGSPRLPADDRAIRLLFVGASFFRKGGLEMLRAVERIRRQYPVTLTIVSGLRPDPYARHETEEHLAKARGIIDANREWIRYHEFLHNAEVLDLMREADVGLLPTWADTYGYVVLEFQGAGCPVITTNVRALAEINDAESGWVIGVPLNEFREGIYTTDEYRAYMADVIQHGIEETLEQICEDPSQIHRRSLRALDRIRSTHDPDRYARRILALYSQTVA